MVDGNVSLSFEFMGFTPVNRACLPKTTSRVTSLSVITLMKFWAMATWKPPFGVVSYCERMAQCQHYVKWNFELFCIFIIRASAASLLCEICIVFLLVSHEAGTVRASLSLARRAAYGDCTSAATDDLELAHIVTKLTVTCHTVARLPYLPVLRFVLIQAGRVIKRRFRSDFVWCHCYSSVQRGVKRSRSGTGKSLIISETIKRMKYVGTLVSSFARVK